MYSPASFQVTDLPVLHDFMQQHSFATIVSAGEPDLIASHLPLLLDEQAGALGHLFGHMARPNTHWQVADGQSVLAIFHGPHAYVSPTWCEARNVVPTWNYVAVHASGVLKTISDPAKLSFLIQSTVDRYESTMPQPWSMRSPDADFIEKLLNGIVGFEIEIQRIEGKWKLSQNHPIERREKVIQKLIATEQPASIQVAELMKSTLDER